MKKFTEDSSQEFIDYCKEFRNKLCNGDILIAKARKFISHHKFNGRTSNNNKEQILDIIERFLIGNNYYENDELLSDDFFCKKILVDIRSELKEFDISEEKFHEYVNYLKESKSKIEKYYSIRAKYRKDNIDDVLSIMEKCKNKVPSTKTFLFFEFIIDLCKKGFLVTNYTTNGSQLILLCDRLHKYSISKIHIDRRIQENKSPCGICGEDTSGNNIFLRNKVYNTEQAIKSILDSKNIQFISYCSKSRIVSLICPLCKEEKTVHSVNIKSWSGCIKCSNELSGNKYTDDEINKICILKGITKFTTYINKDTPIGYRCPKCLTEVYKRLHDILYKEAILCTYCCSNTINCNENTNLTHIINKYGLDYNIPKNKEITISDYLNIDSRNIDTSLLINKILKKGRSVSEASFEASKINSRHTKIYKLSNDKILYLQGYEPEIIDLLIKKLNINENDIQVDSNHIPKFFYTLDNKQFRYYPDIFIPSRNLIIEVKSIYTYLSDKKKTDLKLLSVISSGYNIQLWISTKKDFYLLGITRKNNKLQFNYFIFDKTGIKEEVKNYFNNLDKNTSTSGCCNNKLNYSLDDYNDLQVCFNKMWLNLSYNKKPKILQRIEKITGNSSERLLNDKEDFDSDLTKYINNGNIYINRFIFQKLKLEPLESSNKIMKLLENIKEPLIPQFLEIEISKDYENLKLDTTDIINNTVLSNKNGRHKFLNKIMHPVMIKGKRFNKISYHDAWYNLNYRRKMVDRMIEKDNVMNNNSLYSCFGCMYGIVYNFPPNVAKCLYNYFHANRVLDFCAGYGGRLTGFWTSNASEYVGIDPNTDIPYNEVIQKLNQYDPSDKKVTIINQCAEDVDYKSLGMFDFIFTSPPYFNTEIYSDDKSQSISKYPQFNDWLENFLFKTLTKVTEVLSSKGILAINIKDTPKYSIVQPMIQFIISSGLIKCANILLDQPKRFKNTKSEYIYIFMKPL
jgi:hypothetical protein